jgi:hypothetical protein
MCEEDVLFEIYEFLKLLLQAEFENVCQGLLDINHNHIKDKKKKIRKKTITILDGHITNNSIIIHNLNNNANIGNNNKLVSI